MDFSPFLDLLLPAITAQFGLFPLCLSLSLSLSLYVLRTETVGVLIIKKMFLGRMSRSLKICVTISIEGYMVVEAYGLSNPNWIGEAYSMGHVRSIGVNSQDDITATRMIEEGLEDVFR